MTVENSFRLNNGSMTFTKVISQVTCVYLFIYFLVPIAIILLRVKKYLHLTKLKFSLDFLYVI